MKKLALMSLLFVSTLLSAQEPIKIKLWQNGAPNDNGMTGQVENGPLYVAEPTIEVYPAKESNGLAIVMCPGGGYGHLAMAHEGHDMASWFNSQGITYAVLTYRMPNGNNEVPLSDAQQALRIMRQHAKEWNIQKLAHHAPARKRMEHPEAGHHGSLCRRTSGKYSRHPFYRRRDPPRLPNPFLSGRHYGPDLYSHGLAR